MMEFLNQAMPLLSGLVIVGAMMAFIYKRHAEDWEQLLPVYGRPWQKPRLQKRFANMVLYSEGRPAKTYPGTVAIGLYDDGIALRPNPLLAPFHPAIFVPYADIQGWGQHWYINAESAELTFRKAPHMRVIMPRDQAEWMLSMSGNTVEISGTRPPHGTGPWLTYAAALASGAMAVAVIVMLIIKGAPTA